MMCLCSRTTGPNWTSIYKSPDARVSRVHLAPGMEVCFVARQCGLGAEGLMGVLPAPLNFHPKSG